MCVSCAAADSKQKTPEQITADFYSSFYSFQWSAAAHLMHPEALRQFHALFVHIAETTDDPKEKAQFLQALGVGSTEELKSLDSETVFARCFKMVLPMMTAERQKSWKDSTVQVLGSVWEKPDLVHVVIRTRSAIKDAPVSVVSTVSLQQEHREWKVLLTTELLGMGAKLK
jgi:hypothetical protein